MSNQYLLLFTFGPVQGFIAQARKTADLYAGSQILTEIAKSILTTVKTPHQILFPSIEFTESLTNRIVIKVSGTENEVKELGGGLIQQANKCWENIAKKALGDNYSAPAVQKQLLNHLETYWVAVPLGSNYGKAYDDLNQYASADKNQRAWADLEEGAGRKCALDGGRNALFYRADTQSNVARRVIEGAIRISDESLQPNEALSTVSYLKRRYGQNLPYPSTATIALMDILERYTIRMGADTKNANFNDQLYFEENLTSSYFLKSGYDNRDIAVLKEQHAVWKSELKEQKLIASPYYALLHFDGDDMGAWFSGEYFVNAKGELQDFHKDFTKLLGAFARKATDYLNQTNSGRGRTVYAGGDDFVGFINLNHLCTVLKEIRKMFDEEVNQPLKTKYDLQRPITFSAGVAIAHYKYPLSMVIDEARTMEKKAKKKRPDKPDKNAYGIGLMVRAGSNDQVVLPWQFDSGSYTLDILQGLVEDITANRLSTTFINNLELTERCYGSWDELPVKTIQAYFLQRSIMSDTAHVDINVHPIFQLIESSDQTQQLLNVIEFLSRHVYNLPKTSPEK